MKKIWAGLTAAVIAVISLTGCKSTLRASLEAQAAQEAYYEIDLDKVYSEADGYHYPGVIWGSPVKDCQEALNYSVDKVSAYGTNGESIFDLKRVHVTANGRKNDNATLAATKDNITYMITAAFDNENPEEGEMPQSEFLDSYYKVLTEKFGEPTRVTDEDRQMESKKMHYVSYSWEASTADGKETAMQLGAAYDIGVAEPTYITFGFVWTNKEH